MAFRGRDEDVGCSLGLLYYNEVRLLELQDDDERVVERRERRV